MNQLFRALSYMPCKYRSSMWSLMPSRCLSLLTRFPAQNSFGSLIWTKVYGLYITQKSYVDNFNFPSQNISRISYFQYVFQTFSFSKMQSVRLHTGLMNVNIHEYHVISSTAEKSNYDLSIMLQSFCVQDILKRTSWVPIGWP